MPSKVLPAGTLMEADDKCKLLLTKCEKLIDTFNPKATTVDAWIADAPFLRDKQLEDVELKFIHQVFYGCQRYQKFLKLLVTSFMYAYPAKALRDEQTLYKILSYLLFFRYEDLGEEEFETFINCGHGSATAILALMQFNLDQEMLEKWVKVEWCKHYDSDYIERDIIGKVQSYKEKLRPAVEAIEFKATGAIAASSDRPSTIVKSAKKLTEFKPFNLTALRPRLIPEPDLIVRVNPAQPVPEYLHKTSLSQVEESKKKSLEEHRQKVQAKYSEEDHFKLETANRRDYDAKFQELKQEVEAKKYAECTFQPKQTKRVVPTEAAVVRQTQAQIFKEDARLRQKQQQELEALKNYEAGLHDASAFHAWQEKIQAADHETNEARQREKIIETALARENAIEAQESAIRLKGIMAEHQKKDLQAALEMKDRELEAELHEKQKLVDQTCEEREKVRIAEQEVLRARADNAEKQRQDMEFEFARKAREDEYEMLRKRDLILQIRALDHAERETKAFDPTDIAGWGFLEEMSLSELKNRLSVLQVQNEKETESKRERQLQKKAEKQDLLTEKAEFCQKVRERMREEHEQSRQETLQRKKFEEDQKRAHRDEVIAEVAERLLLKKKQKKDQEKRLKKELKESASLKQFLAAGAVAVEAKKHSQLVRGADREARLRQKNTLIEQKKYNTIKVQEKQLRRNEVESNKIEYQALQEHVTKRIERAKVEDTALKSEILRTNRSAIGLTRSQNEAHIKESGHSFNPYMKKVKSLSALTSDDFARPSSRA
eukprot:TRINITY_DN25666_c0_g1_i1.p1 TRINITY_DN25666_c0_g1~~TRINITY_DN25666_c0_g1_i1.p1  ORF type:complete len:801 (-),score=218.62 TRINITY_DN25666_c0_g1_i1:123-2450(-)